MKKTIIAVILLVSSLTNVSFGKGEDTTVVKLGLIGNYSVEVPKDRPVTAELLYTIYQPKDSTAVQFAVNAEGNLQYRKFDKEYSKFTEWEIKPLNDSTVEKGVLKLLLNKETYKVIKND